MPINQPTDTATGFILFNFSGMRSKVLQLNDYLHVSAHDIILCTETHFDSSVDMDAITNGTEFTAYTCNRTHKQCGGVAIFARNSTTPALMKTWQLPNIEAVSMMKNGSTVITLAYWPPDDKGRSLPQMQEIVDWVQQTNAEAHIIAGTDKQTIEIILIDGMGAIIW